ncbi:PapD-like protein [Phlegmacium glaucopus]|nr:PapD-like protein [Phlegmacium glaucopus]
MVKKAKQAQKVLIMSEGLVAGVSSHGLAEREHVSSSFSRHPSLSPQPPQTKMSVSLNPSNTLGFRRPFNILVKRSLTITNHNPQPVAFKVKTTAPKLYCVRPNSGRVEPGESVEVSVMLQALKEDPPLNTKCKDKFLIQSTIITPEKETLPVQAIWSSPDVNDEGKVYQQKLRVTYLPAEGHALEEEDENQLAMANNPDVYDSGPQVPGTDGFIPSQITPAPSQQPEERASTPTQDVVTRQSSSHTVVRDIPPTQQTTYRPPSPTPLHEAETSHHIYLDTTAEPIPEPSSVQDSVPEPAPLPVPAPRHTAPVPTTVDPIIPVPVTSPPVPAAPTPIIITRENPVNEELYAKYNLAQVEIERLKEQVASLSELRRRPRVPSDAGSTAASDVQTMVEDGPIHQEGVPLQVVVVIAFGVFITTYLFF